MDKVQQGEGWKVERAIAVSPGKDKPTAHHVQTIASGLHDIDFKSHPTALIPVEPSCNVTSPDVNDSVYLILGDGRAQFPLMKKAEIPGLITFTNQSVNALAKAQAMNTIEHGTRKKAFDSRITTPASTMSMKDVFITETSAPLVIALAGGGLYNFHLAPGAEIAGVVVYTGKTGYNNSPHAAVAGVVQTRPDKSWSKRLQHNGRYEAVMPFWKSFFKRATNDLDYIPEENVISVSRAGHFLIGPPPARYEDRIPYVAFGGKTIHYSAAENVNFGTRDQNRDFARSVLDPYYEAHLAEAKK